MKTLTNDKARFISIAMLGLTVVAMFAAILGFLNSGNVLCDTQVGQLVGNAESSLGNVAGYLDKIATAILPIAIILAVFVIMFNHDPRTLKQQLVAILIIFAGAVIIKVVAKNAGSNGGFAGEIANEWASGLGSTGGGT